MKKNSFLFGLFVALLAVSSAYAAEQSYGRYVTRFYGTGTNDNDLLFTTSDLTRFRGGGCMLMSTDGAVDVEGTLDGTNWTTAQLSLQDLGATTVDPVIVTAADRMYFVPGHFYALRVRQNGAAASAASLFCRQ